MVALEELQDQLQFTERGSSWGMLARRGLFEISLHDAALIARAMGVRDVPRAVGETPMAGENPTR